MSFSGEKLYEHEQANYWSSRQGDQQPTCRVTPNGHEAVSNIMRYLHDVEADFSIVSGGHGTAEGASNLDDGITLDLSKVDSVQLLSDKSAVIVGTGARWRDVYKAIDPHNVTVSGARAGNVGVGGFLLGGGISHLTTSHGWGCDSVLEIDMVLSNGTKLHANTQHFPEVLRALKGSGSNIAVPLKFKLKTVPSHVFQNGLIRYDWEEIELLLPEIAVVVESCEERDGAFELSIIQDGRSLKGFLMYTRFARLNESVSWQCFKKLAKAPASVETTTPGRLADNFDRDNPAGYRFVQCSLRMVLC